MELHDFFKSKRFQVLPGLLVESYYWRYMLTPIDREVLTTLWNGVATGQKSYANGLLIANIKQETIAERIGSVSRATVKRSLKKLDALGAIIKLPNKYNGELKKFANCKYFLGFRYGEGNLRTYLFYHLLIKYENIVKEEIEDQKCLTKSIDSTLPKIEIGNFKYFSLSKNHRKFILDNIKEYKYLLHKRFDDEKTIYQTLFKDDNMFTPAIKAVSKIREDLTLPMGQNDPHERVKMTHTYGSK